MLLRHPEKRSDEGSSQVLCSHYKISLDPSLSFRMTYGFFYFGVTQDFIHLLFQCVQYFVFVNLKKLLFFFQERFDGPDKANYYAGDDDCAGGNANRECGA